jgi:D-glycerate 3-kinase
LTLHAILKDFVAQQSLPDHYIDSALKWFMPVAQQLFEHQTGAKKTIVVGLNGCQGSGKSTLTALLCELLSQHYNKVTVALSIDDFYLSKKNRLDLSKTVHPLLATRGVPGTHDIDLLIDTLGQLKEQQEALIPRFDKAIDDLHARSSWSLINEPVDIIILEGWCVGIDGQTASALKHPINALEKENDPEGAWRHYVNQQLNAKYRIAFEMLDLTIMLQSPSFGSVLKWRCEQEHKLIKKLQASTSFQKPNKDFVGIMNDDQIARFIQYYERLTTHALATLPDKSDILMVLNESREITCCTFK